MDYDDYYNATKKFLLNQQQLKMVFEPRKQLGKDLPYLPHIALGGVLMHPLPALSKPIIKAIGERLGEIKFGKDSFNLDPYPHGISIVGRGINYETKLTREQYLVDISLRFERGEIWLGYEIYDFDTITRDIDQHIRYFVDDVPEIHKLVASILHEILKK